MARYEHFNLARIQRFALQERFGNTDKRGSVVGQDRLRSLVSLHDEFTNFVVDRNRRVFAVITMLGDLASEEDLFFLFPEGQGTER